jgi:hypothetical protein
LIAKYEKLVQEAKRAAIRVADELAHAADMSDIDSVTAMTMIAGVLGSCRGPRERAERALSLLVEQSHCAGGFLYTVQKEGAVLVAQNGIEAAPAELDAMVSSFLTAEIDDVQNVTVQTIFAELPANKTSAWTIRQREQYRPLVLGHHTEKGFNITGVAVLVKDPNRIFVIPSDALAALSKSLFDAGDATAIVTIL